MKTTTKRARGRPEKGDSGLYKVVRARVTDDEAQAIMAAAKVAGMLPGPWMRRVLVNKAKE
jgi:hypothetical protein